MVASRSQADANAEQLAYQLLVEPEISDLLVQNHGWAPSSVFSTVGKMLKTAC